MRGLRSRRVHAEKSQRQKLEGRSRMLAKIMCFLVVVVFSEAVMSAHQAQDKPASDPATAAPSSARPTSGARAEFLEEISFYEQRYTRLAEAVAAEKYKWRPADGVRSIGE